MKKRVLIALILFTTVTLFAKEDQPLRFGAGTGLSMGFFDELNSSDEFSDEEAIFLSILSLRVGAHADLTYFFNSLIGLGVEGGAYYLSVSDSQYSNGNTTSTYIAYDFPLRATLRLGSGKTYLQGFGGYHMSVGFLSEMSGAEVGLKACLGGVVLEGSYVMSEELPFVRVEMGYTFNNLLKF